MLRKLLVAVSSTNPVKVEAARIAFTRAFADQQIDIIPVPNVASGVSEQPMTDEETRLGAKNRAIGAMAKHPEADYCVGIEGGVDKDIEDSSKLVCFAWMVVLAKDQQQEPKQGTARTATLPLPSEVSRLVLSGIELGHADDMVFGRSNSKQQDGAVGLLTKSAIDRTAYYVHAMTLALVPFINTELFSK